MKFTKNQLAFIASYFEEFDEQHFTEEATNFEIKPKKVVDESTLCTCIKLDGQRCTKTVKSDGMCSIHLRFPPKAAAAPSKIVDKKPCGSLKADKTPCKKFCKDGEDHCHIHLKPKASVETIPNASTEIAIEA
jgi:hypothetical protein